MSTLLISANHWTLRKSEALALPPLKKGTPGPLSGVVRDEEGNLYFSDEIHHLVASIDCRGRLRWHRNGRGNSVERFRYPRALALGRIRDEGEVLRCLAVCDSWNHRIQFFDLSGAFIRAWNCAGSLSFHEVSDVRFLSPEGPDSGGFAAWLVLDRGNHRLCAMSMDGSLLFQIGRCFSPNLEASWGKDALDGLAENVLSDPVSNFDPVYFPTRILGHRPQELFVDEPFSRRVKQVVRGSLLPVDLPIEIGGEWIAAGASRFLNWDERGSVLRLYESDGNLVASTVIEGRPAAADLYAREVWIQAGSDLQRWEWTESSAAEAPWESSRGLRVRTGGDDRSRFERSPGADEVARLVCAAEGVRGIAEEFLHLSSDADPGPEPLRSVRRRLDPLRDEMRDAAASLNRASHPLFVRLLADGLRSGITASEIEESAIESARSHWMELKQPILDAFPSIQKTADALFLARREGAGRGMSELWNAVLAQLEEDLRAAVLELHRWVRATAAGADSRRAGMQSRVRPPMPALQDLDFLRPTDIRAIAAQSGLRELARIPLVSPKEAAPALPYGLARGASGRIYAGLFGMNRVLLLGEDYKAARTIGEASNQEIPGPLGLAADSEGRVWIVSFREGAIWIYDERRDLLDRAELDLSRTGPLHQPVGICVGTKGRMLVADTGNNRLLELSGRGVGRIVCGRKGTVPGEFSHPIALCPDPRRGGAWVVDQRNHRLRRLDEEGRPVDSVGGLGLTAGRLVLPEFAVRFADGSMVVGQSQVQRALVIFSDQGEEEGRLLLDFAPGGMLIDRGLLLVTEFDGSHLRIYERTGSSL